MIIKENREFYLTGTKEEIEKFIKDKIAEGYRFAGIDDIHNIRYKGIECAIVSFEKNLI